MADLKSELSGSLAKLILGLMLTPAQYDAKQLRKAVEVIVTLLVAQGCQCPQLHVPQGLTSSGEDQKVPGQRPGLYSRLAWLFVAQHAQPAGSHGRTRVGANQ